LQCAQGSNGKGFPADHKGLAIVSTTLGVMQDREAVAARYRVRGAGALTAVQAAAGIAEAHVLYAPAPRA
jgi:hypothetical protein